MSEGNRPPEFTPARQELLKKWLRGEVAPPEPARPPIAKRSGSGSVPLSFGQQRLWFLHQLEPRLPLYNAACRFDFHGPLQCGVLEQCLNDIVRRHEVLRTTFAREGREPVQLVHPPGKASLVRIDLSNLSTSDRQIELERLVDERPKQPLALESGPPLWFDLVKLAVDEHVLLMSVHHAAWDDLSAGIFIEELVQLYAAIGAGSPSPLPDLQIQYADYAVWERQLLEGSSMAGHLDYWRDRLQGELPALDLPVDHTAPPGDSRLGAICPIGIEPALATAIAGLAGREGATLFMALLAAFQALLYRYSGQTDLIVGCPVSVRSVPELEHTIGYFSNTLPMRVHWAGDVNFLHLLRLTKEAVLGAYTHRELPFERIVRELEPERGPAAAPLFRAAFALAHEAAETLELAGGVRATMTELHNGAAKFDLTLLLTRSGSSLRGGFEYDCGRFDHLTMQRMARHFRRLLEGIARTPGQPLAEIPILDEAERRPLPVPDSGAQTVGCSTLPMLFSEAVRAAPHAAAVIDSKGTLSYEQIDRCSNRVACWLQRHGVCPEAAVAIYLGPSAEFVAALLGVLKAGGAYVPISPGEPETRLRKILADCRATVLITGPETACSDRDFPVQVLQFDRDWPGLDAESAPLLPVPLGPGNLAYVIYTSGSTGDPKGVGVSHRAVVRLVRGSDYVRIGAADTIALLSNVAFDAVTFEVWGALLNGARLFIPAAPGVLDLPALEIAFVRENVTIAFVTTAVFNRIVEERPSLLRRLRILLFGGERVSVRHVSQAVAQAGACRLLHVYGPTENTTFSTWHPVSPPADRATTVAIGRAIVGSSACVLDRYGYPVPFNSAGEIHLGGAGLARGYVGRPDLTAAAFIPDNVSGIAGARLYRTGDYARRRPDGNLEFAGRIDGQVKIRGFRVELGEIEHAIEGHPGVRRCAAQVRHSDAGDAIVAWVVAAEGHAPTPDELRNFLQRTLPDYMIPVAIMGLPELPVAPGGKIDYRRLPTPEIRSAVEYVAPQSDVELDLARIWSNALHLQRLGVDDDFFALGGHSLLALQVNARIRECFGVDLPLRSLFALPTIRGLATEIDRLRAAEAPPTPALARVPRIARQSAGGDGGDSGFQGGG